MDNETPPAARTGDRAFTPLEHYYLKNFAAVWQSLDDLGRAAFVTEYGWLRDLHIAKDKQDERDKEKRSNRRWLIGLAIPIAVAVFSGIQYFVVSTAASHAQPAPTSITVKLPSGQTFVVTPAASPLATPAIIQP